MRPQNPEKVEGVTTAKCAICEKATHFGDNVSHSRRKGNRIWKANVRSVKVKTEGDVQKTYICTSCLYSSFIKRA